jgi:hypothetical protein
MNVRKIRAAVEIAAGGFAIVVGFAVADWEMAWTSLWTP